MTLSLVVFVPFAKPKENKDLQMHINKSISELTIKSFPMHNCYKITNSMICGKKVYALSGPYTIRSFSFKHNEKEKTSYIEIDVDGTVRLSLEHTQPEVQVFTEFKEALKYYEDHVKTMK